MPWIVPSRCFAVLSFLLDASLSMAACVASSTPKNGSANTHTITEGTRKEVSDADLARCSDSAARYALEAGARAFTKDKSIPVKEARRHLQLGDCFTNDLTDLKRALRNEGADTFASLGKPQDE